MMAMRNKLVFTHDVREVDKADNFMKNYTFYEKETDMMFLSNIGSACLVVSGVVSNAFTLGVLDSKIFQRTSFRVYLKWVCWYNLISLMLACMRQHAFLLDFEKMDQAGRQSRVYKCHWMLWFCLHIENCMTGSLALLCWNRIWSQRNLDRAVTEVDAMRNPTVCNVVSLLVWAVPTSQYVEGYMLDANQYDMTKCSFSFVHPYGSPRLRAPMVRNGNAFVEIGLIFSLFLLMVEMMLRKLREKMGGKIKLSEIVGRWARSPTVSMSTNDTSDVLDRYSIKLNSKMHLKTESFGVSERHLQFPQFRSEKFLGLSDMEEKDMRMTYMASIYIFIYIVMGMPCRLAPYFFQNTSRENHYPLMILLYLLRQSQHAGTILYLSMGGDLMRSIIADLSAKIPDIQYSSSSALFDPESGINDTSVNIDHGQIQKDFNRRMSTKHVHPRSPPERSVAETTSTMGHLDRLELGVRNTDPNPSRAVVNVMAMRSPSRPRAGQSRPGVNESTFSPVGEKQKEVKDNSSKISGLKFQLNKITGHKMP